MILVQNTVEDHAVAFTEVRTWLVGCCSLFLASLFLSTGSSGDRLIGACCNCGNGQILREDQIVCGDYDQEARKGSSASI